MAPKKQQQPAKKAGGDNKAPAKQKANAKGKKEDDDDALLAAAVKASNKAQGELDQKKKEEKKKEGEKKQAAEKAERALAAQRQAAIDKLPPIYVEEVCKQLYERHGGDNQKDNFREMCWLHFALFNFFNLVIENKRKLLFRSIEHPKGEALASFECHDLAEEDDSPHSWLLFTTASGKVYSVDLTLKQFEPKGKYGYQRDTNEAPAWQPIPGTSRLQSKEKLDETATTVPPHQGSRCKDGGVFPNAVGKTTLIAEDKEQKAEGVADGASKAYAKFLKAAQSGRHQDMSTSEARSARILFKNGVGQRLDVAREELEDYWFTKPLAAAAKAAKEAKKEEKEEAK